MSPYLLLWILVWTILAFALMGIDKWKAKREAWRVPEKVLFLSALAGGSIGALAGMAFFRHKTLHWSFPHRDARHPGAPGGFAGPLVLPGPVVGLSGKMPKDRWAGGASSHSLTT